MHGWRKICQVLSEYGAVCGLFLLGVVAFAGGEWRALGRSNFPFDDSWIFCQYARNLAEGKGLCFNEGEPSNGFTSLLWVLLCAATYCLTGRFIVPMKAMGVLLGLGCVILVQQIVQTLTNDKAKAKVAGLVASCFPPLIAGALSGMDTPLFTFTGLLGLWWHVRYRAKPSRAWMWEGVIWGVSILARPENAVLWLIVMADKAWQWWRNKTSLKTILFWLGINCLCAFIVACPWLILNLQMTGTPYPTTYLAKVVPLQKALYERDGWLIGGLKAISEGLWQFCLYALGANPVLAVWTLWMGLIKRQGKWLNILSLIALAFMLIRSLNYPTGALLVWSGWGRYSVPAFLCLYSGFIAGGPSRRWLPLLFVLGFLPIGIPVHSEFIRWVSLSWQSHVALGKWLERHTPPDAIIATHDIGTIGFFGRRRIFDTQGLIHSEITPYLVGHRDRYAFGVGWRNEQALLAEMQRRGVSYFVGSPLFQNGLPSRYAKLFGNPITLRHGFAGERSMVMAVYRLRWREWQKR